MKTVKNHKRAALGIVGALALSVTPQAAFADEGGISFWLPGNFGSLAAVPGTPGWSWATVYYHTEVSSAAGARFPRGGRIDLGIGGQGDLAIFGPTYTFAVPGLGAVGSVSLLGFGGRNNASVAASLTGPLGNTINLSRSEALTDIGDVIPQVTLKWNKGVNNIMVYATGDVPVGAYDPVRLANIGIGHGAMDFGGGYTYFDPHSGNEFSGVVGFTYNFKNPDTQYQSGVDFHFDWGASHFFTPNVQLGLVGYVMQQISDDTGPGATLGGFRSRIAGVGPQVGFMFPVGDMQGYLNIRGYKEFAAENRPDGWNTWVTFAISPAPPAPASAKPIVRKY
ncbi:SphA family protein [Bradyrhizobium sp. 13971]